MGARGAAGVLVASSMADSMPGPPELLTTRPKLRTPALHHRELSDWALTIHDKMVSGALTAARALAELQDLEQFAGLHSVQLSLDLTGIIDCVRSSAEAVADLEVRVRHALPGGHVTHSASCLRAANLQPAACCGF